jgi:osmotically inducible lipoprotein OsmB
LGQGHFLEQFGRFAVSLLELHSKEEIFMAISKLCMIALVGASTLGLLACGTTPGERAVSGGLIGAGGGAAIGAVAGDAGTGAVVGGLAGAAAGALTDPCEVNLGDPVWRDKHASREDYYRRCGHYPR